MIGHSIPEYIFIRICIWALRLVAPLSIAYVASSWYTGSWIYSRWIGYYALIESCFYFFVYLPRSKFLQEAAKHPELLSRKEREALFAKCFARMSDTDQATGWFYPPSPNSIRRENMLEWILWALFASNRAERLEEWEDELEGYIHLVEKLMGRKLEDGWDEDIKCMKVSMDPIVSLHRPFVWYLIVALVDTYTTVNLVVYGFQHYTLSRWYTYFPPRLFSPLVKPSPYPQLSYWYRPHRSKTKHPIVFFHGIGIGLVPYVPFLAEIAAADPDVGIIAIENLSISMRISPEPLTREEMLEAVRVILDYHSVQTFVVAGHSYGSVTAAHVMRSETLSPRVAGWLFVDPIPFLLHLPAVAYNFVYRTPKTANEWQLWYFASRDPDIARSLGRHFFWAENILWREDLAGRKVGVVLSGRDQIVDAAEVRKYLTGEEEVQFRWKSEDEKLEVLWYPDLDHSKVFDTTKLRRPMVDILHEFVKIEERPESVDEAVLVH